jgi:hypothetical protein
MDSYETFNDLFNDLFKKSKLTPEQRMQLQGRQRAFFEEAFPYDESCLHDFLYNKHLSSFGNLFRKFCDIIDISQNKLSDICMIGYGVLLAASILKPGANIGALSHDSISNAQLGSIRPTSQQIFFWIAVLDQCFKELKLEILPEAREAFYLLGLGAGTPEKIAQAVEFVKAIGPTQQWKIAKPIDESIQKDTDVEIPSAHPEIRAEKRSDMLVDGVEQVRAHLQKIMEQEQES